MTPWNRGTSPEGIKPNAEAQFFGIVSVRGLWRRILRSLVGRPSPRRGKIASCFPHTSHVWRTANKWDKRAFCLPPLPCSWHLNNWRGAAVMMVVVVKTSLLRLLEMSGINRRAWVSRLSLTRPGGCRVESRRTGPLGGSFWFRLGLGRQGRNQRSPGRRHGCTGGPESGRIRPDLLQNGNVPCVWSRLLHRVHPLPEVWARWEQEQPF